MRMEAYCVEVQKLEDKFDGIEIHHVLRWDNKEANFLARLALSRRPLPHGVFLDVFDPPRGGQHANPGWLCFYLNLGL